MSEATHGALRELLCQLGLACRDAVLAGRRGVDVAALARVDGEGGGDTIYAVDRIGEAGILEWFRAHWPKCFPVQIVMEGLVGDTCFPQGIAPEETDWKCIIDPIDGTRGIMYDKRSAWALAGIAPQAGEGTMLSHIVAAAMTEIPTTRQWRADQFSATRGGAVVGVSEDVRAGGIWPLEASPSQATGFAHGFSSLVKFFPEGRTLTAQIEERLWDELIGLNSSPSPVVFDDQYICTGGQFYELATGRDRMVGDLRPLIFRTLDMETSLVCHPYDCCTALVLQQAGVVFEHPLGGFPDAPLDTESGVAWVAYANESLAAQARPVLTRILEQFLA
jgi:hypothetical protein